MKFMSNSTTKFNNKSTKEEFKDEKTWNLSLILSLNLAMNKLLILSILIVTVVYVLGQQGSSWWFFSSDYHCALSPSSVVSWSLPMSLAFVASTSTRSDEKGCLQLARTALHCFHRTSFSLTVTFLSSSNLMPSSPYSLVTSPHCLALTHYDYYLN